jgi:hypothetical protein
MDIPAAVPSNPENNVKTAIPMRNCIKDGLYPKIETSLTASLGMK